MSLSPFAFVLNDLFLPDFVNSDDKYFAQALKLAQFAMGSTHPNPSVGAVLVDENKRVAEGYTQPVGGLHAEKHALSRCVGIAVGSVLYVTLEPCSHFGRTPPCTDAIIAAGVKRVVFGAEDPNPIVNKSGIAALKKAGIEVERIGHPFLQRAACAQILPFKSWVQKRRPYVVVKVASTMDNKMARHVGTRSKITGPKADVAIHQLRRAVDCVMVGKNTAQVDNPLLTARLGKENHNKQPTRIVISNDLMFRENLFLWDQTLAPTIVITTKKTDNRSFFSGVEVIQGKTSNGGVDLDDVMVLLAKKGFTSLLIEPGVTLFETTIFDAIADEVWWVTSPKTFGNDGLALPLKERSLVHYGYAKNTEYRLGDDRLSIYKKLASTDGLNS